MDRKAYSKAYNEHKQLHHEAMNDAIKRFQQENPERYAELQIQAKHELEHPPERRTIRYSLPHSHFDVDKFIRQHHTQDYYIFTKDAFGNEHTYFESLDDETPEEVLTRRHSKFAERREEVIKVEECKCPLCQPTSNN